jgi:hypothetical protein
MKKILVISMCAVSACTYSALNERGRAVSVADGRPEGCENLGMVIGKGGGGWGEFVQNESLIEYAMNDARNKAAELGATHMTLSSPQLGGGKGGITAATIQGFAYRCQGARAAVPQPLPPEEAPRAETRPR